MIKTSHILMALILAAAMPSFGQKKKSAVRLDSTVSGRVTDFITHNGIGNVTIETVDSPKQQYVALTDQDGFYKLEHLPRKSKLTLRCHQMGYSPNPTESEIDFKNGTGSWNPRLFLASAGKDYLTVAADLLSTASGAERIADAQFVAENSGPEGEKFIAQELRKRLNGHSHEVEAMELAAIFHFDQLPPESQPRSSTAPTYEADAAPAPSVSPDQPAARAPASVEANASAPLEETLESIYGLTRTTADRTDIVTPGSVLVLHKDNLLMSRISAPVAPTNTYRDGEFSNDSSRGAAAGKLWARMPGSSQTSTANRKFVAGEKFWVTKIDVKKNSVVFELYSDPIQDERYYALLKFPFPAGTTPDIHEMLATVSDVLTVEPNDSSTQQAGESTQRGAASSPAAMAPVAPPPPAAAAPSTIALGQTKDMVTANLGQPQKVVKLATKEIYFYPDMKVTFVNGKVTDVQ